LEKQAAKIKKGDVEAFGIFFRSHYSRMFNYCRFFVKEEGVIDDLVQETFVHLWEKRDSIDPRKSLEALLFVSLRNRCLNYMRDTRLEHQFEKSYESDFNELQHLTQIDFLGEEEAPLEEYLLREMNVAIRSLPERCREVIQLAKLEGLKNREVAQRLGISVKAVEKQIAYGKKKISDHLQKKNPLLLMLFMIWFG